MPGPGSRLVRLLAPLLLALLLACGRAADRPASGAAPGRADAPTSAVPPTLTVSDDRLRAAPALSPGPDAAPSPVQAAPGPSPLAATSPVASPAASGLPPIVRTITPVDGASVAAGAPVAVSAVLVGRGADLADATLTVDGGAVGAVDQQSPRQWTVRASQALPAGTHTVRVIVNDVAGGHGGFTWRFTVGGADPATKPRPSPAP